MRGIKYLHPIEALHDLLLGARQPRPTLRVGDYRVIYKINGNEVWIFAIKKRKDFYTKITKRI
jgi:hypothetical protein